MLGIKILYGSSEMKNFNDYAKRKRESQNRGDNKDGSPFGASSGGAFEALNALAGKYEGASESEIMRAIYAEAKRSRKNGTLSNERIDEFVETISPMLSREQAQKLAAVAQKIKNT